MPNDGLVIPQKKSFQGLSDIWHVPCDPSLYFDTGDEYFISIFKYRVNKENIVAKLFYFVISNETQPSVLVDRNNWKNDLLYFLGCIFSVYFPFSLFVLAIGKFLNLAI